MSYVTMEEVGNFVMKLVDQGPQVADALVDRVAKELEVRPDFVRNVLWGMIGDGLLTIDNSQDLPRLARPQATQNA